MSLRIKSTLLGLSALSLIHIQPIALAEAFPQRQGYSFFGAGIDLLDYEENTTYVIGSDVIDVETPDTSNFTQQSGAYVAMDAESGFYLTTASTLGESIADEEWFIGDIKVRSNRVIFERQRLAGIATLRTDNNRFLLYGAEYSSTEFKRFAASLTADAAGFGITDTTFASGTISEHVWDLTVVGGYEWNTLFTIGKGWRYQVQLLAGLPLYSSISNTEIDEGSSFNDSVNGLHLRANFVYGYQYSRNFVAAFALETAYTHRNEIDTNYVDTTGPVIIPESNLFYFYPSFTMYWSF